MPKTTRALLGFGILLFPPALLAHPGAEAAGDLLAGLLHPLTGLDHLLAMLAVGMYAARRGGRWLWVVPIAFVLAVAAGAVLAGAGLPPMELGVAGSVLVFGLLLSFGGRLTLPLGLALAAGFALCHGLAHGAEAPVGAGLGYGLGFLSATALLHAAGIALVSLLRSVRGLRLTGGAIAAVGGVLLLAL